MFLRILKETSAPAFLVRSNGSYRSYKEYISEVVYGGIDGTITSFAVVAGATGAGLGLPVIIILGVGSLVADGLSMAVGSFFSKKAERDLADSRERDEGVPVSFSLAKSPFLTGLTTFVSFSLIGSVPLIIYVLTIFFDIEHLNLFLISSIGTAVSLSFIGLLKSVVTEKSVAIGIAETMLLGGIAAVVAYYIGFYLDILIQG